MDFLINMALFSAKTLVIVMAILLILTGFIALVSKGKALKAGKLQVKHLNSELDETKQMIEEAIFESLDKKERKQIKKSQKSQKKSERRSNKNCQEKVKNKKKSQNNSQEQSKTDDKRVFVLEFDGDIRASQAENLRKEITALLSIANKTDEVVLKLTSPGGMVHGYGFAAAQLDRIKQHNIPLTIAIDKVAASGGYMMACVADQIIAAPFAIIGSIGAVIQLPNFNKWLKKHDIEFEQLTAGEHKRTLTMFGHNSDKGREKMQEDLETTHALFKNFIRQHRPQVDLTQVATGEHWFGSQAIELQLIDQLATSDDYLYKLKDQAAIYLLSHQQKKSFAQRITEKTSYFLSKITV